MSQKFIFLFLLNIVVLSSIRSTESPFKGIEGAPTEISRCEQACNSAFAQCWVFNANGGAVTYQCCKLGYAPTSETDPSKGRCQPMENRCSEDNSSNPFYCLSGSPFKVCCPKGQSATCESDKKNSQCVKNSDGIEDEDAAVTDSASYEQDQCFNEKIDEGVIEETDFYSF